MSPIPVRHTGLGDSMHTAFNEVDGIAASLGAFESFISRMEVRCDLLIRNWQRNREVWNDLPAKITARIIDIVRGIFLNPIYPKISLRQIAQMARVTEGSIYRLFGNRAGLTECVRRHTIEDVASFTRKLIAARGAAGVTLKDIALGVGLPEDELRHLFGSMDGLLKYILRPK
jgi:AcrR family transcriptional regulator